GCMPLHCITRLHKPEAQIIVPPGLDLKSHLMSSSDKSPKSTSGASGSWIGRFFLKATIFVAGLGLCGALLGSLALALAWPNLPDLSAMIDYRPRVPLRIYTADKVLIGEFGEERRNVLRFDEIPDVMKSAILSDEDDRFY